MASKSIHMVIANERPRRGAGRAAALLASLIALLLLAGCGDNDGKPLSSQPTSERYDLTGSIRVTAGTAVDSDVNDPFSPFAPNDTPATAQPIPNPVSVGGYVNTPGAGPSGRSQTLGDPSDFYRIDMTAGQTITLSVARSDGDFALFVNGAPVRRSFTVPDAGTYVLEVRALAGASTYVLSVGQAAPASAARGPRLDDDFVPGEIIVRWRDDATAARGLGGVSRAASLGMAQAGGGPGRARLLRLGETAEQLQATFRALGLPARDIAGGEALKGLSSEQRRKWQTLRAIGALREREDVVYAEPNYLMRPLLTPGDPFYAFQWHYPQISLPQAWDLSTGDRAVIVAVVDTGVVLSHPDLETQLTPGYDFVDGDADPNDPGDQLVFSSYHGTHVAGTVAAATNNNPVPIGVAGTGWGLRIMPLRALTSTGGTQFDILQAVRYAAGLENDSGTLPLEPADVINLSLGGEGFSQAAQDVFTEVRSRGIITVAAAGNTGSRTTIYPAGYAGVVGVSAVDQAKQVTAYSSYGPTIDVAAPGGDLSRDANGDGYPDGVLSTWADDSGGLPPSPTYAFSAGTSMAAPHVAGVAALMKSLDPSLTPEEFDNLLASGLLTRDLGAPGWDERYGFGLIDAFKALTAVGAPASSTPTLAAAPSALNLGGTAASAQLSLRNAGPGSISVDAISEDPDSAWLTISAEDIDPDTGLGSYRVTVDRSALGEGTYSASLVFAWSGDDASGGELRVPVIMQVENNLRVDDAGTHYVLLLDEQTGQPLAENRVDATDGRYDYAFVGVPPGRYLVVAGSDPDNDQLICAAGEACGAYLTLDQLQPVVVDGNRSGLDFVTSFEARVDATGQGAAASGSAFVPFER